MTRVRKTGGAAPRGVPVFSAKATRLLARGPRFVEPPAGPDGCSVCRGIGACRYCEPRRAA